MRTTTVIATSVLILLCACSTNKKSGPQTEADLPEDYLEEAREYEREANKVYPQACEEAWVDMGVESDDGKPLYWATSDLIIRADKTFGLSGYGVIGDEFGWGDNTGLAEGKKMSYFGGETPPNSIVGDEEFDIVSAHLKKPSRLPSVNEWIRLQQNCTRTFVSITKSEMSAGKDGLPAWVQGQWMAEERISMPNGEALNTLSIKIDGITCSVIGTQGGQTFPIYDGVYDYHRPNLVMGGLTVIVDEENGLMVTENGYGLAKISNDTESSKVYGLMLTSNINGATVFFPLPPKHVAVSSGDLAMEFESEQECNYWSGTLYDEDSKSAMRLYIKGDIPTNVAVGWNERYNRHRVRPVSTRPTTVTVGRAKNTN